MRPRKVTAAAALLVLAVLASSSAALGVRAAPGPATFSVGADQEDITPAYFPTGAPFPSPVPPTCVAGTPPGTDPASYFNGIRYFAFEDPYHVNAGSPSDEYDPGDPTTGRPPEPFCKLDATPFYHPEYGHVVDPSHRYEGIYLAGGNGLNRIAKAVTPGNTLSSRAVVFAQGTQRVAVVAIDSIGTFNSDFNRVRDQVAADVPALAGMQILFSSTHDESAPDPIGIWGQDSNTPGVNHLYMDFFVARTAAAIEKAATALQPAHLRITETLDPNNFEPCFSSYPFLADRHVHVLQAVSAADDSTTIASVTQYGMHDELLGFSGEPPAGTVEAGPDSKDVRGYYRRVLTGDAQGYLRNAMEAALGGVALALPGPNGSVEMPMVFPPGTVVSRVPLFHTVTATPGGTTTDVPGKYNVQSQPDPTHPGAIAYGDCGRTAYPLPPAAPQSVDQLVRAQLTGQYLAADATAALQTAPWTTSDALTAATSPDFYVPLNNNSLFLAGAQIGLFPDRAQYLGQAGGTPTPAVQGTGLATEVSRAVIGDAEFITLPGEMFPQTTIRGYLGPEQMAFAGQTITPWLAASMSQPHRFFMGLGQDMIGYLMPPGNFVGDCIQDDTMGQCVVPQSTDDPWKTWQLQGNGGNDRFGEHHSDDSESVGPPATTLIATALQQLELTQTDPTAQQLNGRYINADGTLTRVPLSQPVGVWLLPKGVTTFAPGVGTIDAVAGASLPPGCQATGTVSSWMDYDGLSQTGPDESTAGVLDSQAGQVTQRLYVDVYADLAGSATCPVPAAQVPESMSAALLLLAALATLSAALVRRRRRLACDRVG